MAFVSEVTAKMNIDKSGIDRDLTAVQASFGRFASSLNKELGDSFSFKKLGKGILQGIGIGSTQDIKELITKPFEDAAKSAKEIEESTARTLKIYEGIYASRRTDEQNLAANRNQQARLQRELAQINEPRMETIYSVGRAGQVTSTTRQLERTKEQGERAAAIAEQLAQLAAEETTLTQKLGKEQKANDDRRAKAAQDFAEKQDQLRQQQEDFLTSQKTLQEQLADIEQERMDLAERMSMSDEDTLDLQRRELELTKEQARIEKQIADDAERRNEEINKQVKALLAAGDAVTKSRNDYKTELRDRSGFTLSEVSGQRTNFSARNTARNIQRLEEQARRVRLTGGEFRDQAGKIVSREEYADQLINRADTMRKGLGMLTSREKDPMAQAAEAIKKSEEHLSEIVQDLKPTQIR